jgi:hypothetical protein
MNLVEIKGRDGERVGGKRRAARADLPFAFTFAKLLAILQRQVLSETSDTSSKMFASLNTRRC